jgi:peptide/nickel transport system substrate-binding protein
MSQRSVLMMHAAVFAASMAACGAAHAQAGGNVTVAVGAPVTSMDPHYHTLTPNEQAHSHIFDRLVETDRRHDLGVQASHDEFPRWQPVHR